MRIFIMFLVLFTTIVADFHVRGIVLDKTTKEPLVSANIVIVGTYKGTITNFEGKFFLKLNNLPVKLKISYIGYKPELIEITENTDKIVKIFLEPAPIKLSPFVVTAEDPVIKIMKKVLEYKKEISKKLISYKSEAYTRFVLKDDSSITAIKEVISEIFWHQTKGTREVIKKERKTANLSKKENFMIGSSYIANFYHDDIQDIIGNKVIGPTNPDIFKYYKFKLIGTTSFNNKLVYKIELIPKTILQPVFKGQIWVLDSIFALIKVDLMPVNNNAMPIGMQKVNIRYIQQFNDFGKGIWLPMDVLEEGSLKIGVTGVDIPTIVFKKITRFTNYEINYKIPDSLYKDKNIFIKDTLSIRESDLLSSNLSVVPLSQEEESAYKKLDSTYSLQKQYEPKGMLAKMIKFSVNVNNEKKSGENVNKKISYNFSPYIRYNRVENLSLGGHMNFRLLKQIVLNFSSLYSLGLKKMEYSIVNNYMINEKLSVGFNYNRGVHPIFKSFYYNDIINSFFMFFSGIDYFDYLWSNLYSLKLSYYLHKIRIRYKLGFNYELVSSLEKTTDYVLFKKYKFRDNIYIPDKKTKTIEMSIESGNITNYGVHNFGIIGNNGFKIDYIKSFDSNKFYRIEGAFYLMFKTFLKRRIISPMMNILVRTGYADGDIPFYRLFSIDTRIGYITPYGTFKAFGSRPLICDNYVSIFAEHNFRTVLFELLGLDFISRHNIEFIMSYSAAVMHFKNNYNILLDKKNISEIGISINNIFNLIRLDYFKALNSRRRYLGISIARFF